MTSEPSWVPQPMWHRAQGVELLGPVSGSGLTQVTCLVRRADGQVIQLSELLNLILVLAESAQTSAELAQRVSSAYGRELSAEGLELLIGAKLQPLGLVSGSAEGAGSSTTTRLPTADPLLALRFRGTLLPARLVRRIAAVLSPLFAPTVVIAALAGLVVMNVLLFATADPVAALDQVIIRPVEFLLLFGLLTTGAVIHELGHATACRYGGARPGAIGVGLYLVFPAFFTNVTDSYRLGRAGRLRTDLGGLYFNVLTVLAAAIGHLATGNGLLLLVVILMQLQMLQQLPPVIRLDGYYVLADLAGVPDLFNRVGPVIRSLRPGAAADPRLAELRPAARRIVTIWVITVVPLLTFALAWTLWTLPIVIPRIVKGIAMHSQAAAAAFEQGQVAATILSAMSIVFLALPLAGLVVVLGQLVFRLARANTRRRQRRNSTPLPPTAQGPRRAL